MRIIPHSFVVGLDRRQPACDLRRALRNSPLISFLSVLLNTSMRSITIQELSEKADIHRVTIYKHFMDIYDVYEQLENMVLSDLGLLITEHGAKLTYEVYGVVFQYIKENSIYFKMIFSPHCSSELYWKVQKMVEGLNRFLWSESFEVDMNDSRIDCAIHYHSNGVLSIIGGWVQSDFAHPETFIIDMLQGLDKSTQEFLRSLLNI